MKWLDFYCIDVNLHFIIMQYLVWFFFLFFPVTFKNSARIITWTFLLQKVHIFQESGLVFDNFNNCSTHTQTYIKKKNYILMICK